MKLAHDFITVFANVRAQKGVPGGLAKARISRALDSLTWRPLGKNPFEPRGPKSRFPLGLRGINFLFVRDPDRADVRLCIANMLPDLLPIGASSSGIQKITRARPLCVSDNSNYSDRDSQFLR